MCIRDRPLTFPQCTAMHLLREELSYEVTSIMFQEAAAWFAGQGGNDADEDSNESHRAVAPSCCKCPQCSETACGRFEPPKQPRWGACRDLICCQYDSWRRMEQIRKARGRVSPPSCRSISGRMLNQIYPDLHPIWDLGCRSLGHAGPRACWRGSWVCIPIWLVIHVGSIHTRKSIVW